MMSGLYKEVLESMSKLLFEEATGRLFNLVEVNLPRDLADQLEEMIGCLWPKLLKEGEREVDCYNLFRGEPDNIDLQALGSFAEPVKKFRADSQKVIREALPEEESLSAGIVLEKLQGLVDWAWAEEKTRDGLGLYAGWRK